MKQGTKIYHPLPCGTHIGTTENEILYSRDEEWYCEKRLDVLVDEPKAYVRADCAFAKMADDFNQSDINPYLMGVGQLGAVKEVTLDSMSVIDERVLHVGRTTGLRRGMIVAFGYEHVDVDDKTI
ncbi:MAG: hypothetical protein MUO26_15250 [Methanotrichaceae archaeon]|nr:hypothetical protein [Methanotrichaceae archaeon]